ncbi:MAG: hypothetical protein WEB07_02400 [Natronospirillum sp.]
MIGWGVAALLILSAIGSLLWAVPSKADQRRAEMRDEALRQGLSLVTLSIPDTSERGRIDRLTRLVTGYKRRAREAAALPSFIVLRSSGESGFGLPTGWVWENPAFRATPTLRMALVEILNDLPLWVELLAITPEGLVVSFDERRGTAQVSQVNELLERSCQRLLPL